MTTAIVVGSGPNGLAAGAALAKAGVRVTVLEAAATIGGGTRTSELTLPGLLHDHCSAFHPMGLGSPFLRGLDLTTLGVTWRWAAVDLAHPLDGGRAGVLTRSLAETADRLGADGPAWQRLIGPLADGFDDLAAEIMRPVLHVPRHPLLLAGFGLRALAPATAIARRWRTDEARALFAGIAAHGMYPLNRPTTAAIGLMLAAAGHAYGWPVAQGGSQSISNALAAVITEHGGSIETGGLVTSLSDLPPADLVMLDVAPGAVAGLAGDRLPARVRRAYQRYRHGPGAFKLDLAVEGGIPWTNAHCRQAGTVHVGGTLEEIAAAEQAVHRGQLPDRPFVLVGQQYLADPTRSRGDTHPVWAYAHVPAGYQGDVSEAIISQVERFAPGFRDRIVARARTGPAQWPSYNPNFAAGDILTGANTPWQVVIRPRLALDPYRTGIPGVYLCSAATPPGAGVHGMGGYNAVVSALRDLRA
ncbi:MAG TPA: NAD(P)/FAD-dependent oxidoreductase [Streptosporangiaceae bacterium]